jgi:succinate dehydrogenase / fumarate reductase cytochrome b subunit
MRRVAAFYRTTIGKKAAMAVTGAVLFLFVVGHMVGNLKAFQGPDYFNHYAEGLRTFGAPFFGPGQLLWVIRLGLLAAVGIHALAAVQLWLLARRARPTAYARVEHLELSVASRSMRWGGLALAAYVTYHLMHFTLGNAHPDFIPGDAYHNLVVGFRSLPVVAVYLGATVMLGLHVYHGVWSGLQTLGANHPHYNAWRRGAAGFFAAVLFVGFLIVPIAVQLGVIR